MAPEPGQVGPVYTLYRLYTGPLLIRGKSDCWPLQLAGAGLSTLPTRSFRQLTEVQRVDSSRSHSAQSSEPLLTSVKSEKQVVDRKADSSGQTWSCEVQLT